MGDLFIGVATKGFTGLSQKDAVKAEPEQVTSAIAEILRALEAEAHDEPVEIVVGVMGKNQRVFTVSLENSHEIREILEWSVGR